MIDYCTGILQRI